MNAPGGFAEALVSPAHKVYPADDLPLDVAVFAEPLACVVHGMDVLGLRPGADVLMMGAGTTGLLLAQLLLLGGAGRLTSPRPLSSNWSWLARTERTGWCRSPGIRMRPPVPCMSCSRTATTWRSM